MKQFQVPQFITVEDQVIGPLTIKQALYLLAGLIIVFIAHYIFVPILFWPIAIITAVAASLMAFMKINDVPLPIIVKNGFWYIMRPHVYIWKKEDVGNKTQKKIAETAEAAVSQTPTLSESKLSDLAWSLNIKEKMRESEEEKEDNQRPF